MSGYRPGWIAMFIAALAAAFLLMPLLAVVPVSFTPTRFLAMPEDEWSLRHYRQLVENPAWGESVMMSIRIGLVSSILSTILAVMFGLGIWMLRPRFAALLVGIVLLPMVVPPVVSALTLYFLLTALSRFSDLVGYDTWLGVALAHVVMIVPFAVVLVLVALSQVDRRIDLAARGLGASLRQRAFRVILPNIKFGVLTAALLSFVLSWEEIGVTLFVSSVNVITLPRRMWMGLRDNIDPAIAAVSVVLIVLTVAVLLVRAFMRRGEAHS